LKLKLQNLENRRKELLDDNSRFFATQSQNKKLASVDFMPKIKDDYMVVLGEKKPQKASKNNYIYGDRI
jgi:hypothetical protein